MAEDGLLPNTFAAVHPVLQDTTSRDGLRGDTWVAATGFCPWIYSVELVSIGTLLAFVIVCASVLILRKQKPENPETFSCSRITLRTRAGNPHLRVHDVESAG